MQIETPVVDSTAAFHSLTNINTVTASTKETFIENIKRTLELRLPRLQHLPEFYKVKGENKPIALVGGGPSLKNYLNELREFKTIIACGSVHDYLIENNIIPTYATACDPDPVTAEYFKLADTEIKYLIATCCDKTVFDKLKDKQIIIWHSHSPEQEPEIKELDKAFGQYLAICGGCTVGLRSLSIAITFGYSNIHLFGFDSCIQENKHHVYGFATEYEESLVGTVHPIRLGNVTGDEPDNDKTYYCLGYQMAQAQHFKEFYETHNALFKPTFHGTGLLPDLMKLINKRTVYLESQNKAA